MGQPRVRCGKSRSIVRVKHAVKQLQKCFLYLLRWESEDCNGVKVDDVGNAKEGHFSVLAMSNGESKKFLVALRYLAYPPFLKLLEEAETEFGFDQQGVLAIPCEASELQRILS